MGEEDDKKRDTSAFKENERVGYQMIWWSKGSTINQHGTKVFWKSCSN